MSAWSLRWSFVLVLLGGCSLLVDLAEQDEAAVDQGDGEADAAGNGQSVDASTAVDASASPQDGQVPPEGCSQILTNGTCVINCATPSCDGDIECPAGRPCLVNCVGSSACENVAIDCSAASSCNIFCQGSDACDTGGIICGGTDCAVSCVGDAACEEGLVDCQADICDLRCEGGDACAAGVCCGGEECPSDACDSVAGGNCSCPL